MLDALAASIMKGCISAPLTTSGGEAISGRDGQEISAWSICGGKSPENASDPTQGALMLLFNTVDACRREYLTKIQELTNAIMSGQISAPLTSRNGAAINTRSGTGIDASKYIN